MGEGLQLVSDDDSRRPSSSFMMNDNLTRLNDFFLTPALMYSADYVVLLRQMSCLAADKR